MYIDSHCHIDIIARETSQNSAEIINQMKENHISRAVQISIETSGFSWSWELAEEYPGYILFTAGIHPNSKGEQENLDEMERFMEKVLTSGKREMVFGIGECGLDYYRMTRPKEEQHASFHRQIEMAEKWNLPVIIHTREAFDDTMAIIKEHNYTRGVFHCFPGNKDQARLALDTGFYISYAGNVTFKKALDLQESASFVPVDRILLETDSPYLAPVPRRGKTNRPEYVAHTYDFVANLKKIPLEKLIEGVEKNFNDIVSMNSHG
jgi:TatD DNase family protein